MARVLREVNKLWFSDDNFAEPKFTLFFKADEKLPVIIPMTIM